MSHVKSLQDGTSKVKSSCHFFTPSVLFDRLPSHQSNATCPVGILVPENGDEITLIRYLLALWKDRWNVGDDGFCWIQVFNSCYTISLSIFLKFWHFVEGQVYNRSRTSFKQMRVHTRV